MKNLLNLKMELAGI